jgi:hypothetical protein
MVTEVTSNHGGSTKIMKKNNSSLLRDYIVHALPPRP